MKKYELQFYMQYSYGLPIWGTLREFWRIFFLSSTEWILVSELFFYLIRLVHQSRFDQEEELLRMVRHKGFVIGVRPIRKCGSWWCSPLLLLALHPMLSQKHGAFGSARLASGEESWMWLRAGSWTDELEPYEVNRNLWDQLGPAPVSQHLRPRCRGGEKRVSQRRGARAPAPRLG